MILDWLKRFFAAIFPPITLGGGADLGDSPAVLINAPRRGAAASGKRREEFPPDDKRVQVSADDVRAAWAKYTTRIPVQFAVGTAEHESTFTINEVDTEPSGFVSKGIFQLSDDEARSAGMPDADLLSLDDSARVFARISEKRLDALISAAKLDPAALPADVWAYLALAHNQGLGAALKTVKAYGLDWSAYKQRNPDLVASIGRYGDDTSRAVA